MAFTNRGTPVKELQVRILNLQTHLQTENIDSALILQNTDLFYFSGTLQQSFLYIPSRGEPILMVRKHPKRAKAESGLRRVVPVSGPKKIPETLRLNGYRLPRTLGLECDVLPVNLFFAYQTIFNGIAFKDISHSIRLIRAVKSGFEIEQIRKAAACADQVADAAVGLIREGMTEVELAGKIEAEARKLGHQGVVRMRLWGGELFYGHLMAGPSAAVPSYLASPTGGTGVSEAVAQGPGFRRIKRGEPILLDYVFVHNGYMADHTRIFAIGGVSEELHTAHGAMLKVQQLLKEAAKPGMPAGDLYDMAVEKTKILGFEDHFMGVGPERIRFVGHGIGLEIDEYPFLAKGQTLALQPGMAVALEPKLVFPGQGVVGIENTHVMTENGLRQLTAFPEKITIL